MERAAISSDPSASSGEGPVRETTLCASTSSARTDKEGSVRTTALGARQYRLGVRAMVWRHGLLIRAKLCLVMPERQAADCLSRLYGSSPAVTLQALRVRKTMRAAGSR